MRFTQTLLAALSIAGSQAVIITNSDFTGIEAGKPFTITFAEAVGQVTVYLGTGTSANLIQGAAIGSAPGPSGSITWTPASGGNFAFKIVDAGAAESTTNPNFSGFFEVTGSEIETTTTGSAMGSVTKSATSMTMMTTPMTKSANSTTMMTSTTMMKSSNGTSTTASSSKTSSKSDSTSSSTGVPTQVPNSMAANFASPIAFVCLAVGALLTLN